MPGKTLQGGVVLALHWLGQAGPCSQGFSTLAPGPANTSIKPSATLDEFMTDALRGELQCNYHRGFIQVSHPIRDRVAREVKEILGKES